MSSSPHYFVENTTRRDKIWQQYRNKTGYVHVNNSSVKKSLQFIAF